MVVRLLHVDRKQLCSKTRLNPAACYVHVDWHSMPSSVPIQDVWGNESAWHQLPGRKN